MSIWKMNQWVRILTLFLPLFFFQINTLKQTNKVTVNTAIFCGDPEMHVLVCDSPGFGPEHWPRASRSAGGGGGCLCLLCLPHFSGPFFVLLPCQLRQGIPPNASDSEWHSLLWGVCTQHQSRWQNTQGCSTLSSQRRGSP